MRKINKIPHVLLLYKLHVRILHLTYFLPFNGNSTFDFESGKLKKITAKTKPKIVKQIFKYQMSQNYREREPVTS